MENRTMNRIRWASEAESHLARNVLSLWLIATLPACTAIVDQFSGREEACQILATGKPATAKILQLRDTGITINRDPVAEFVLEVYPGTDPPFRAHTRALISRLEVPQAQPGRIVPVKYDPQQRTRVAIDLWECDP